MTIKSSAYSLLLAIYFGIILNITIYYKLFFIFKNLEEIKFGVLISIPILFVASLNIIFTVLTIKYIEKPLIILLLIISSIISYQMFYYGIVFDTNMFVNIFETNAGEGWSFVNPHILTWFFVFGLLPSILISKLTITYKSLVEEIGSKSISIIISIAILLTIYLFYYKDIASIGRNNRHLRTAIVPTYFTYQFIKYIKNSYFKTQLPYKQIGLDIQINKKPNRKNNLSIIVIGETARSMNFELNGYSKDTNKYTKPFNTLSFKNVQSCGTATAVSLPCMFSALSRYEYEYDKASHQDNLIDILKRTNINMVWLDNDNGCKGVCNNIKYIKIPTNKNKWCDGLYCYDGILVEKTKNELDQLPNRDAMIFLHLIGSHGPTYYKRYPNDHRLYLPDCPRSDIQNCSNEQLVNSYDNTIAYTDFVLSKLIELLKTKNTEWNTSLIYISDHGESLGEYGLYLHGAPYFMAPEEQTKIPMQMWFSDSFTKENNINLDELISKAKNNSYSHDNFFHTILGLASATTNVYDRNLDILNRDKS